MDRSSIELETVKVVFHWRARYEKKFITRQLPENNRYGSDKFNVELLN
jgi:hypothetical protein